MGLPASNEAVSRALVRTRWLHAFLILLVLFLGLLTLQGGRRLSEAKRELAQNRRLQLLDEVRTFRERGEPGWFQEARSRLDEARRIRADRAIRQAWLDCLTRYPSRPGEIAVPYRVLVFPSGLNRAAISFSFSTDGKRILSEVEGRNVIWNLEEPQRAPRVLPGPDRPRDPPTLARLADSRLEARIDDGGRLELHDTVTGRAFLELRGRSPLRMETVAWSADGTWLVASGLLNVVGTTPRRMVELWHLPALRSGLALLDFDWKDEEPSREPATPAHPGTWVQNLKLGLGALLVLLMTAAVITNQHLVYRRCLEAQNAAAARAEELEEARERIAHADKMRALGTLAAGVAHDFNNLLSVIQMSRQLIERSLPSDSPAREHLGNIAKAVDQGRSVVRSILGYSRENRPAEAPPRLLEVVDETLNLLRRQFLGGLEIQVAISKELGLHGISRSRLEQVLLNFLVNASEAMGGRGVVRLTAREVETTDSCHVEPTCPGPWIRLSVADTGPGITEEIVQRIFEPFFTTKNLGNQRGTGLGLATVWRIATEFGLGLGVRTQPGLGSEFLLFLPTAPAVPQAVADSIGNPQSPSEPERPETHP